MRILLIEDNLDHVLIVRRAIQKAAEPCELIHAPTLAEGEEALTHGESFGAVLLDMSLPDSQGVDSVSRLEAVNPDVPIVVLTSLDDDQTALSALQGGAQDYLLKDKIATNSLMRALCHAVQRQSVRVENRRLLAQLKTAHQLLERKNKRLRKLYKTAQRFLDNVSHEFRTPLTVIKEYGSLIRDGIVGPVNDEQSRMLNTIEDRACDLNTMVDDMLDVSRLEAGVMGMWRKNCRISDLVDRVLPALSRKASVKDVQLTLNIDNDLPEVYCDGEKIGRVVTNLVVNAIKFVNAQGIVEFSACLESGSNEVRFSVTDNGPGIDSVQLQEIFQRFKQCGVNARGSCKGFGLGLNIAKELVDLNFGSMDVSSKAGQGSTFSFTVPVANPIHVIKQYTKMLSRRRHTSPVSLMTASISPDTEPALVDDASSFLNYALRADDLMLELNEHHWLLAIAVSEMEVPQFMDRIAEAREKANRNRPFGPIPEIEIRCFTAFPSYKEQEILDAADNCIHQFGASLATVDG